jgi:hypothetical protein
MWSKKWAAVAGMAGAFAAVLVVAGLVGGALAGVTPASAQEQEPTPTPTTKCDLGGWHLFGWGGSWTLFDTAAEALNLTPEELFSELHSGKTLSEIADAQGVDLQAVQDALNANRADAFKQSIEQAVADGKITQEQADWMLEGLEKGFYGGGRGLGLGGGFRGGHGLGGGHAFGRGWL